MKVNLALPLRHPFTSRTGKLRRLQLARSAYKGAGSMTNSRCGSAAEEPMVCRLSAGAEWIRTFSSAPDGQQFVVSSELGPMDRRTVIQAVAGLGEPLEFRAAVRGVAPHRLDQAGVTPRSRCRRCEPIAEPKVRIRSPPARSQPRTGPMASGGRQTLPTAETRPLSSCPAQRAGAQRLCIRRSPQRAGRLMR